MWPSQNAAVYRMYSSLGQAFCPRIGQDFGCGAENTVTAQDECSRGDRTMDGGSNQLPRSW